jgi:hypothetical protein
VLGLRTIEGSLMEDGRPNRGTPLAARKDALLAAWLTRTLETYPASSREFLAREKDSFRNPMGHTLREGLTSLLEGLLGAQDVAPLAPQIETLVRLQVVQDLTPSQALAFLFLLKDVAGEEAARLGEPARSEAETLEKRIDQLALAVFDLYVKCREEISKIQLNAAKRSLFVQLHRGQREAAG